MWGKDRWDPIVALFDLMLTSESNRKRQEITKSTQVQTGLLFGIPNGEYRIVPSYRSHRIG